MGYNADPDQDGYVNLVEYARRRPQQSKHCTPNCSYEFYPDSHVSAGDGQYPLQSEEQVAFSFLRRTDDSSLVYTVYTSEDLSTWHELDLENASINTDIPNYERVYCPIDDSNHKHSTK